MAEHSPQFLASEDKATNTITRCGTFSDNSFFFFFFDFEIENGQQSNFKF